MKKLNFLQLLMIKSAFSTFTLHFKNFSRFSLSYMIKFQIDFGENRVSQIEALFCSKSSKFGAKFHEKVKS